MHLRFRTSAPVVLDEHNVESEVLRRQQSGERTASRRRYQQFEAWKQERFEISAWGSASAVAVTSEREVDAVAGRSLDRPVVVVPNAVDPDYFAPAVGPSGVLEPYSVVEPSAVDADAITFVGSMTYRPNLDGILYFVQEILPLIRRRRPSLSLTVVGQWRTRDVQLLDSEDVIVTGVVPDVRPYLARAACVVAPIRMGGGTRLKILEALAMGKALVSTTLGCEGLAVSPGQHLLVADDPQGFADEVCRLLEDPGLGERLGAAGLALVAGRYTWSTAAARLTELFRELAPGDRRAEGHAAG
jgi:glycosyltransferase involved in cell wall biosynthesis